MRRIINSTNASLDGVVEIMDRWPGTSVLVEIAEPLGVSMQRASKIIDEPSSPEPSGDSRRSRTRPRQREEEGDPDAPSGDEEDPRDQ